MTNPTDIETRFAWVPIALVILFGTAFAVGLILHVRAPGSQQAAMMLQAGLVLLMASPAVRLVIAVADRLRRRDWVFVLMTLIVAAELAIVLWRASHKP